MMLRIQACDIAVHYKKGKADTLSRACQNSPSMQENLEYVSMVVFLTITQENSPK